jgi:hypothetical protein
LNPVATKWGLAGIALASPLFLISAISQGFVHEMPSLNRPVLLFVTLLVLSGFIYLLVIFRLKETVFNKELTAWIVFLGLIVRLSMFLSTPILEDDHYRYLWDGAVLANGHNPYKYAPEDIRMARGEGIPKPLLRLAEASGHIIERINYPWLKTIYPPVTQGAFALAYIIKPWHLAAWRTVTLAADLITLYLLFILLRQLDRSLMGMVVYWWNPLLIKEVYNTGHMEVIIFPFILLSLLLAGKGRFAPASAVLGIGVGTKIWPVLLSPVILRPLLREPKRMVHPILVFVGIASITVLPQYMTGLDTRAGIAAYSREWEMNDSLFMLILWVMQWLARTLGYYGHHGQVWARFAVVAVLFAWLVWVVRQGGSSPRDMVKQSLMIVAALFLLSPTQFPWYFLWMLPLLAMETRVSLLLLTALLPLYYLRYFFKARGMVHIHDYGIVWIEFVPVWILLIWEWYRGRKKV